MSDPFETIVTLFQGTFEFVPEPYEYTRLKAGGIFNCLDDDGLLLLGIRTDDIETYRRRSHYNDLPQYEDFKKNLLACIRRACPATQQDVTIEFEDNLQKRVPTHTGMRILRGSYLTHVRPRGRPVAAAVTSSSSRDLSATWKRLMKLQYQKDHYMGMNPQTPMTMQTTCDELYSKLRHVTETDTIDLKDGLKWIIHTLANQDAFSADRMARKLLHDLGDL